jgi:AcrR family transcriptional regulator
MSRTRISNDTARASADKTRVALIDAGLALFGEKGFPATSTREIAAKAKANIGSIAYHFGGKEGLRDACATHIVATIQGVAGPLLGAMPVPDSPRAAEAQLGMMLERMTGFLLVGPEAGRIAQFILRELQHPTRALDIVYEGVFAMVHRRLCAIWGIATGDEAESEHVKLAVFTMIGQIVYFRIAREAVIRRMGWRGIGDAEAAKIAAVAAENLTASIAARRGRAK